MSVCPKCGKEYEGSEKFCAFDGSALDAEPSASGSEPSPEVIQVGDRYRIISELGSGGMGSVYLARHEVLKYDVAIKVLHDSHSQAMTSVARFILEARSAAKLDHENIASILDFGRDARGRYYLVMEYVPGKPLSEHIEVSFPFEPVRVVSILRQIFSAAAAAHSAGIVHRDLKPDNILCTAYRGDREFVKILDFGLAKLLHDDESGPKLTQPGFVVGTPHYMPPEQATGQKIDGRTDLYAIGVIAYELLSGSPPFEGGLAQIISQHLIEPPKPLKTDPDGAQVPAALGKLVMKLLEKSPDDRPSTAEECVAELDRIDSNLRKRRSGKRSLLERTRADVGPRTLAATWMLREDSPPRIDYGSSFSIDASPTVRETGLRGTFWDGPELDDELGRLSEIWRQHFDEIANRIWPEGSVPSSVRSITAKIAELQESVVVQERELETIKTDIKDHDSKAQEELRKLRFRRLDLVAEQRPLEDTLSQQEVSDERGAGALPKDKIPQGFANIAHIRRAVRTIQAELANVDVQLRRVTNSHQRGIASFEEKLIDTIGRIHALRVELSPLFSQITTSVRAAATAGSVAEDHIAALEEITGAMEVYRAMLKSTSARND